MKTQPPPLWLSIFGLSSTLVIILSSIIIVATTAHFLPKPNKSGSAAYPVPTPSWNSTFITLPETDTPTLDLAYPSTWYFQRVSSPSASPSKPDVTHLNIFLFKDNQSSDLSAPDEPTKNMVMIDFALKKFPLSTSSASIDSVKLYEIMNTFPQHFGFGDSPNFSLALKENIIDQYPAYFKYRTIEEASSPSSSYPERILVAISPTTVLDIEIGFYFQGQDTKYYVNTVKEINEVISRMKITSEPSTWKTYTNQNFGYEIKYPSVWYLAISSGNPESDDIITSYNPYSDSTPKEKTLQEFLELNTKIQIGLNIGQLPTIETRTKIKFAGFSGEKITYKNTLIPEIIETSYLVSHNGRNLRIDINSGKNQKLVDEILSTFKFI